MLQLNPLRSEGRINLSLPGLPLATRYLDDVLDFDLDGGLLDTTFDYPGVTTRATRRSTGPLLMAGSPICSQMATATPRLTSRAR